ncbi:hypothetical protein [Nitrosopumilus sp.]|uniref:hypothetical protein n=1 Tax=Nitrosopumilus sp. TaxID=2024843 RepID=UPI00292F5558|nr:hypothetical protein [Nitrosopumilus sp.]
MYSLLIVLLVFTSIFVILESFAEEENIVDFNQTTDPIKIGDRHVAISAKYMPTQTTILSSEENTLQVKLFDTDTGENIPESTMRMEIWREENLVFKNLFYLEEGKIHINFIPHSKCEEETELWRCVQVVTLSPHTVDGGGPVWHSEYLPYVGPVFDVPGTYKLILYGESLLSQCDTCSDDDEEPKFELFLTIEEREEPSSILPPKKQIKNGILSDSIICKEELKLVFKNSDKTPACVKMDTGVELAKRSWITTEFLNVQFFTDKDEYDVGEPITITMKNLGPGKLWSRGPTTGFWITDENGGVVAEWLGDFMGGGVEFIPGQEVTYTWDQHSVNIDKQHKSEKYTIKAELYHFVIPHNITKTITIANNTN